MIVGNQNSCTSPSPQWLEKFRRSTLEYRCSELKVTREPAILRSFGSFFFPNSLFNQRFFHRGGPTAVGSR